MDDAAAFTQSPTGWFNYAESKPRHTKVALSLITAENRMQALCWVSIRLSFVSFLRVTGGNPSEKLGLITIKRTLGALQEPVATGEVWCGQGHLMALVSHLVFAALVCAKKMINLGFGLTWGGGGGGGGGVSINPIPC